MNDKPQAETPTPTESATTGNDAMKQAKETTANAVAAFKTIISDPIGGQLKAYEELGSSNALKVGGFFGLIFSLCGIFAFHHVYDHLNFEVIVTAILPVIALFGGFLLVTKIFGENEYDFGASAFTTGVAITPLTAMIVGSLILGFENVEAIAVLGLFCACITIIAISTALQDIYKLSAQKAVLITPTLILVSAYLSKLIYFKILV